MLKSVEFPITLGFGLLKSDPAFVKAMREVPALYAEHQRQALHMIGPIAEVFASPWE